MKVKKSMLQRYKKLGYVALNVSDLEHSLSFYVDMWGLQRVGEGPDGSYFLTCSDDHHNVMLYTGKPGLKRLAWQLESEADFDRLIESLGAHGHTLEEVPADECKALRQGRSLRFTEPYSGATFEYFVEMERGEPFKPTLAKIQRLGHVVVRATNYDEALKFYTDVLNYRMSDQIGERVTFLRCFPNKFHHSIGLNNSQETGFHHVNFMVSEIDDIGKAMWRFRNNDIPIVRGPGRHPPSESVFLYVLDPDGITVEYSYGMEEFPEENPRQHRRLPFDPSSIDYWGSSTDPRLGQVGYVEPMARA